MARYKRQLFSDARISKEKNNKKTRSCDFVKTIYNSNFPSVLYTCCTVCFVSHSSHSHLRAFLRICINKNKTNRKECRYEYSTYDFNSFDTFYNAEQRETSIGCGIVLFSWYLQIQKLQIETLNLTKKVCNKPRACGYYDIRNTHRKCGI